MKTRLFYLLFFLSCFCLSAQIVFTEDFSNPGVPNGWTLTGNVTFQGGSFSSSSNSYGGFTLKSPTFSLSDNYEYTFNSHHLSFLEDGAGNITPKEGLFYSIKDSNNNAVHYFGIGTSDEYGSYDLNEIFTVNNSGSYFLEITGAIENFSNPTGSHQNLDILSVDIEITGSLGKTEYNSNNGINIYPNPVSNKLNIHLTNDLQIKKIEVYNLLGKKLKTTTQKTFTVNDLVNGMYLLKVTTDKGTTTKKLIKK